MLVEGVSLTVRKANFMAKCHLEDWGYLEIEKK